MYREAADFAFQFKRLLFRRLCKFSLKRILLSTVTPLFAIMMSFSFGKGSPLSRLIERNRVNLMFLAFRTVSCNFLGNIHFQHYLAFHKENMQTLIPFHNIQFKTSPSSSDDEPPCYSYAVLFTLIGETEVQGIYRGGVKPQRACNSDGDNRLFGAFCFGHETNQKRGKDCYS